MITQTKKDHDIFVMREALDTIERSFESMRILEDARTYVHTRLSYLRAGINSYEETGHISKHIARSLSDLYSNVLDDKVEEETTIWPLYKDVRDYLQNVAMDA